MAGRTLQLSAIEHQRCASAGLYRTAGSDRYTLRTRIEQRTVQIGERDMVGKTYWMIVFPSGAHVVGAADPVRAMDSAEAIPRDVAVLAEQTQRRAYPGLQMLVLRVGVEYSLSSGLPTTVIASNSNPATD